MQSVFLCFFGCSVAMQFIADLRYVDTPPISPTSSDYESTQEQVKSSENGD